ncbi:Dipeptide transport system permease protein DppB [Actinokineospora spheciospongiae]|uniref:Dipeptide transport system permease protein DppB n=1 Tax=Actinokineospora spheciospongiae TaxID=909613 RepID=W7J243_9PSEU|nr:ABC transporter permease [Actinokineospora spheciospongiae]EWC60189.1 Dipeptide transport system permease protein DppB [Actinokineospora spheciospongiae]PWW62749.1 peptide/nickel transport system permease protein [Actinokineospora spheciospongiae]
MTFWLLRRVALFAVSLLVASVLVFALLRLLPGDVAATIAGTDATPQRLAAIRAELGLDRSLPAQYGSWLAGVLRGDFGTSQLNGASVSAELGRKLSVTAPLVLGGALLAVLVALPFGVLAAVRNRTFVGTGISAVSQVGIAVPTLWLGLVLVLVFSVQLGALPAQGFPVDGWADPGSAVRSLVLPWVALGLTEGAVLLRFVRSAVLGVLHSDFLRTARAKGLTRGQALRAHGFRNAALPVVSVLGVQLATLIVGAVVVERVFTLPGVGSMLVVDVGNRDLVKVQGEVFLVVAAVLVISLLVDVAHRLIDPRLREVR